MIEDDVNGPRSRDLHFARQSSRRRPRIAGRPQVGFSRLVPSTMAAAICSGN